jgi:hypothetical protein
VQLHREQEALRSRGAGLALVGIGSPAALRAFREDTGVTAPLYVDPSLATYRALGMRRGWRSFLSRAMVRNALRAMRAGQRNGRITGDYLQHGGILAVRPGGEVLYRYLSATAGDHPRVGHVLAALGPPRSDGSTQAGGGSRAH